MTLISIVVPSSNPDFRLNFIHENLSRATRPIEVIVVVSPDKKQKFTNSNSSIQFVVSKYQGRGFACYQGVRHARGEIIIFLHDDTNLPPSWDEHISNVLKDPHAVGGAFSLAFDRSHWFLKLLIVLSNILFKLTGELWGDRAIFIRSQTLKNNAEFMKIPIMEDVKLSRFMKKKGQVVMIREKVRTSSKTFFRDGIIRHTMRIIICRIWYTLGGDPDRIYQYYYPKGS